MDRKEVIRAIDICLGHGKCNDCSYHSGANYSDQNCRGRMLQDVLALLKEQDEQIRFLKENLRKASNYIELIKNKLDKITDNLEGR